MIFFDTVYWGQSKTFLLVQFLWYTCKEVLPAKSIFCQLVYSICFVYGNTLLKKKLLHENRGCGITVLEVRGAKLSRQLVQEGEAVESAKGLKQGLKSPCEYNHSCALERMLRETSPKTMGPLAESEGSY